MFRAKSSPRAFLSALALLILLPAAAQGAAVLTLDDPNIIGLPGDLFTLTGSITNATGPTEPYNSVSPLFTSAVLTIDAILAPSSLGIDETYNGDIVRVQILPGALAGNYPATSFALSYGTINGRTFNSNAINISVEVTAIEPPPATIPEPSTFGLGLSGLAGFLLLRKLCRIA